jgi:bifunctional DNase/RNase
MAGVSMDLPDAHPQVLLRESNAPYRELRIPVGLAEGTAIAYAWRGMDTPRPLTHELLTELLSAHQVSIEAVRILARRGQTFYAELQTMGPKGPASVQCRPSDAIALMLRQPMPTPLLVAEEVFEHSEAQAAPETDRPVGRAALNPERP